MPPAHSYAGQGSVLLVTWQQNVCYPILLGRQHS